MQRRKRTKWFELFSSAPSPVKFDELSSEIEPNTLISFLVEKILSDELKGYISLDKQLYVPKRYIIRKIMNIYEREGIIDVCTIIDLTGIAGKVIEEIIRETMQNFDGFFDLINRKFYSKAGAIITIKQILKNSSSYDLKYLLNQLYWSEDQLEAVLILMADKELFNGYIDPLRHRLYNFMNLSFSLESMDERSIKTLSRFIQTSFHLSKEVALVDLSNLTNLKPKELQEVLTTYRSNWSYISSKNHDFLFPTLDILLKILLDTYVYKNIPLEFWIRRLDVDPKDLFELLSILNEELEGELTHDVLSEISLTSWFGKGIDIEKLALKLHLDVSKLLKQIIQIGTLLNLKLVAGDTINPFLMKGKKDFEIFCQIDTSSYTNPSIYFECQNCRRVMCSNCRQIESTHECPFCGNISAFIVDLPRNCPDCQITYTHSYNLEIAEECHFCKEGPLKPGWFFISSTSESFSPLELRIESYIRNSGSSSLELKQIINYVNQPSDEVIKILEKLILNHRVSGKIDILDMRITIVTDLPKIDCKVCGIQKTNQMVYICTSCKSDVCTPCYAEMETVGMTNCPECGNKLEIQRL